MQKCYEEFLLNDQDPLLSPFINLMLLFSVNVQIFSSFNLSQICECKYAIACCLKEMTQLQFLSVFAQTRSQQVDHSIFPHLSLELPVLCKRNDVGYIVNPFPTYPQSLNCTGLPAVSPTWILKLHQLTKDVYSS